MVSGVRRFVAEIFQDVDGGFSAKRTILFVFVGAFIAIILYVIHYGVAVHVNNASASAIPKETLDFLSGALDKLMSGIQWLAVTILGERAPQLFGKKPPPETDQ